MRPRRDRNSPTRLKRLKPDGTLGFSPIYVSDLGGELNVFGTIPERRVR